MCDNQQYVECYVIDDWCKILGVIDTENLAVAKSDESGAMNAVLLLLEDPFVSYKSSVF